MARVEYHVRRRDQVEDLGQRIGRRTGFGDLQAALDIGGGAPLRPRNVPRVMGRQRHEARAVARPVAVSQRCPHRLRGDAARRRLHDEAAENLDAQMTLPTVRQRGETGAVHEVVHQPDRSHARGGGFLHRLKDIQAAAVQMRACVDMAVHGSGQKLGAGSSRCVHYWLHGPP